MIDRIGVPIVIDSSALIALLVDAGSAGQWVAASIKGSVLAAPELALFEAANILRRQWQAGSLDTTQATLAHQDLVDLPLELWPYTPIADRAWELRGNLTTYDGTYVALAELLETSLITLDTKLSRAPGPRCPIIAYDGSLFG
jgi:predicted nucleic acid-binding protein